MAERFRHFVAIDWSGAAGERHKGLAVAIADAAGGAPTLVDHRWSRSDVLALLQDLPPDTLVGLDLGISLPFADCGAFFPGWDESPPDARALWALVDRLCAADPHFAAQGFVDHPAASAFFRNGTREGAHFRCDGAGHGRGRFRVTEAEQARLGCRPTSNFNLVGASQVGKSSLTGMRLLHRLAGRVPVWPVDPLPAAGSVVTEIYTTIAALAAGRSAGKAKMRSFEEVNAALAALGSPPVPASGPTDDHSADALVTAAWLRTAAGQPELWSPAAMTDAIAATEGWTFGVP
ncbi:hypothetical protein [Croceibacterium aestuarii]|uniref:hypothetical protein n=1 Tax=Croceibacterium aestuarii TaxID=3064139 RepID=UPI00272DD56F|nr:hypothetical protein [Croceibacterium sp. D39]